MARSSGLTREEELLLHFGKNVSAKSSALFYGNAFIVSVIPIWLFWRIHQMDLAQYAIIFLIMTGISTYLVALAYKSLQYVLEHKFAQKREDAVNREFMQSLGDKKMPREEKDERILWRRTEVATFEATTFAIFFNNALYLACVILASFYCFRSFSPTSNYFLSVGGASALLALLSTGSK